MKTALIYHWPAMPPLPPPGQPVLIRVATTQPHQTARQELRTALRQLLASWSRLSPERLPLCETAAGPVWPEPIGGHGLDISLSYADGEGWIGLIRGEWIGVTSFMIWTEEFILDKPFVKAFCQAILDSGLAIRWVCNSRVDAVDEETLRLVKKAGCWQIAYGIESGVQGILDGIKKQNSLAQNRRAVELAKKAGLQVTGHVIVGLPGDTAGTMAETEKFINSLGLDFVQYYCATPYPGTELYDEAKRNGWINSGDWSKWEQNFAVLDYPHLKSAEVMATRNRFLRRYYFRPKIAFRILRDNIRRSGDIFPFIRSVKGFLEWM